MSTTACEYCRYFSKATLPPGPIPPAIASYLAGQTGPFQQAYRGYCHIVPTDKKPAFTWDSCTDWAEKENIE